MLLTNKDIYSQAIKLHESFYDENQELPVRINFYLQKNKKLLMDLSVEIEESRSAILAKYGVLDNGNGTYKFDQDNALVAQNELNDLLKLEQEVNIYKIKFSDFPDDLVLTTGQMEALMFMIE